MGRVTRASDRHIIWSNRSLDVDDWREDYKEFLKIMSWTTTRMMSRRSMSGWWKPMTTTSPMSE